MAQQEDRILGAEPFAGLQQGEELVGLVRVEFRDFVVQTAVNRRIGLQRVRDFLPDANRLIDAILIGFDEADAFRVGGYAGGRSLEERFFRRVFFPAHQSLGERCQISGIGVAA